MEASPRWPPPRSRPGDIPDTVTVDPSGKYAYVTNDTGNSVSQYTISADGSLTPNAPATVAAQGGPNSLAMSRSASPTSAVPRYAYVANWEQQQHLAVHDRGEREPHGDGHPHGCDRDESRLLSRWTRAGSTSTWRNTTSNTVSQYAVGADGSLTSMSHPDSCDGQQPYSVTVDPSGKYAYAANFLGNERLTVHGRR